ncbi:50S ribosomal protein L23 [endosymbiont of Pachyrhynchus infernalis]|uniref:50S ribosomal protein L23 n=1 Tax=endosymbiont of Pachyrhynchus infernalis TaxID=1971488 RepID=UPI000DC6E74B|nr:50S ribosomal protein L23 [endosymbiont of Pachyrhynchus infernalis]BBA84834.1 50S ribosomal protein L23 [endosymbiont of Pachyrhynchus infernalis]
MNLCKYFECIKSIHLSKKSKFLEKYNILVLKIDKNFTKNDIKKSILNIFKIKVKKINILKTKKKIKRNNNNVGYTKIYKKAFIFLNKNEYININKLEDKLYDINKV